MRTQPRWLLLVVACALLPSAQSAFAKKAGAKGGKKKAAVSPSKGFGGGGFGSSKAKGKMAIALPSVGDAALDSAISARCETILKSPTPQVWLELGSLLVKGGQYAEAERVFRVGAARFPGVDMLSAAALTLGGDSMAYCRKGAASPVEPAARAVDDDAFDGFEAPPAEMATYDQADRCIDWSGAAADIATRGAVFKSREPLLDPSDCAWVVEQVVVARFERPAASGWRTAARHDALRRTLVCRGGVRSLVCRGGVR